MGLPLPPKQTCPITTGDKGMATDDYSRWFSAVFNQLNASLTAAPAGGAYVLSTANPTLTNAQVLSQLSSGILRVANGTGVLSTGLITNKDIAPGVSTIPMGGAGGDLSGNYPAPKVAKINGQTLGNTSPVTGWVLIGQGLQWDAKPISGDASLNNSGTFALASTAVVAGTYTINGHSMFTVDAKGRLTSATNNTLAFSDLSGNISTSQMNSGTGASSSTFWRGDGTWVSVGNAGVNKVLKQIFTASGTYTPSANMLYCIVEAIGAGGGGGGGHQSGAAGGGGGAGGYSRGVFSAATIGASKVITINAAGTGGASSATSPGAGGTGGTTTVGALITCNGGVGGLAAALTSCAQGGTGGTATTGDINITGGGGGSGTAGLTHNMGGMGGSGFFGGGGAGGTDNNAASVGLAYGSGGGAGQGFGAGAAGLAGVVFITEFTS